MTADLLRDRDAIYGECLDHVIVIHEAWLRRILKDYFEYYESCRTHLSLDKDAPVSRPVEPPSLGDVIQIPRVGGLHHLYTRTAPDRERLPNVRVRTQNEPYARSLREVQFFGEARSPSGGLLREVTPLSTG